MKKMVLLSAALLVAAVVSASALTPAQVSAIDESISSAKLRNVSSVASELVVKATEADRQDVVTQVVRATKSYKAGALVSTVVAISKACPEMAPFAAATASGFSKSQAVRIAKAAMQVAPAYADAIAQQVAEVAPAYADQVKAAAVRVEVFVGEDVHGNTTPVVRSSQVVSFQKGFDPERKPYTQP